MLDLKQIESFYPKKLTPFKKNLLREYLQYKILEAIFDSEFGERLVFMGGTAARMVHENTRFSEDLDFDNQGLGKDDFEHLTALVKRMLKREGYRAEVDNKFRAAYTCNVKMPGLLYEYGLTSNQAEKMLVKINTEPQHFEYRADKIILNKFDVFLRISVVPPDILLAQKIYAIFNRRRAMGRDFYDTAFLLGKTRPNLDYLGQKLSIRDGVDLKERLLDKCRQLDLNELARDVEPFLFMPADSKKVLHFCEYIESIDFESLRR